MRLVAELERTIAKIEERRAPSSIEGYRPYAKQRAFHAAGAVHRERLFMAGNQLGKTTAAAMEAAMHLAGRYPDWWEGRRYDRPVKAWAAGLTGESTRDNPQRLLLGQPQERAAWGSGVIPSAALVDWSLSRGVADSVDSIVVRHSSGGHSYLSFKTYEKGREKWQGETLDFVWFDEEPPADVYSEGLTRTNATNGFTMVTFTPLLGYSDVVRMFLTDADLKLLTERR